MAMFAGRVSEAVLGVPFVPSVTVAVVEAAIAWGLLELKFAYPPDPVPDPTVCW